MFDNNVFISGSCKNISEGGCTTGYELQSLITYYRGIPLSMVEDVKVACDGVEEPAENIRISIDQTDWFSLREAETVVSYKWEYGEPLYIRVIREGGLASGIHQIRLTLATRTAYIPVPLVGKREETVSIA